GAGDSKYVQHLNQLIPGHSRKKWRIYRPLCRFMSCLPQRRYLVPMRTASNMPSTAQVPVAIQVACQPPTIVATHATRGGPRNCPRAETCCIQPSDVGTA